MTSPPRKNFEAGEKKRKRIIKLLSDGYTFTQISLILKMSKSTLLYHMGILVERSDTYTYPGLVGWAFRTGYIK